jgi:hypothetical protein
VRSGGGCGSVARVSMRIITVFFRYLLLDCLMMRLVFGVVSVIIYLLFVQLPLLLIMSSVYSS